MNHKDSEDKYYIARSYLSQFFDFPRTQLYEVEWLRNMLKAYEELTEEEKEKLIGVIDNVIRNLKISGTGSGFDITEE